MTAEATLYKDALANTRDITAPEALSCGEIMQTEDGRAGVTAGLVGVADAAQAALITAGQFTVAKIVTKAICAGSEVWFDRSASTATPIRTADSFYLGVAVDDAATTASTCVVDLNLKPNYLIEMGKGQWTTAETDGLGVTALPGGNEVKLAFDTATEAAMAAIYSADTIPAADGAIFEADVAIYDIGDNAAVDFAVGVANGTNATDFDSVTESAVIHLDGSSLNICAESDDGSTEVAATDTTVDAVDDTYFHVLIDCRDIDDIQFHIDGVPVLGDSTFKLDAATGPFLAIAHLEKSSDDSPADLRIKNMTMRATDLA